MRNVIALAVIAARARLEQGEVRRTNGEIVDLLTAPLTDEQVAWCVEQARNCDIDRDQELSDRGVLASYVRHFGADELAAAGEQARLDCPTPSGAAGRDPRVPSPQAPVVAACQDRQNLARTTPRSTR